MGGAAGSIEGRTEHKEGTRVRKAPSFLTVGRASRGGGGFVRQLRETAGNKETAQMGEGAWGFLLPKRDVSDCSPALPEHLKITSPGSSLPCVPRRSGAWKTLSFVISALPPP